jgi:hypothetical protein
MTYRIVRVNDDKHSTLAAAFADMVTIIERGFYWKRSKPVHMPLGTAIIAMGSHGGQGLFLIGVTHGEWEREHSAGRYGWRIEVAWQHVVYKLDGPVAGVKLLASRFNERFGAVLDQGEYQRIHHLIMSGTALDMYSTELAA